LHCTILDFHTFNISSLLNSNFGATFEIAQLFALSNPIFVAILAKLDAHHAIARFTTEALILFFQRNSHFVRTDNCFSVAFAFPAIGTNTSRGFCDFNKVMVFAICEAIANTKFAVKHILVKFFALTAS